MLPTKANVERMHEYSRIAEHLAFETFGNPRIRARITSAEVYCNTNTLGALRRGITVVYGAFLECIESATEAGRYWYGRYDVDFCPDTHTHTQKVSQLTSKKTTFILYLSKRRVG